MSQLNKLQIKAEIMTVMAKLQQDIDTPYADQYLSVLNSQEDKSDILDILLKELQRSNEQRSILICFILVKLFDQELLEEVLWNVLKNRGVMDDAKRVVLKVLKNFGNTVDIDKLEEYFENPKDVIDAETQTLLNNAIVNPEAQIDFLDFLTSLSFEDKEVLIQSLAQDYSSDALANILSPVVLYSPESEIGMICIDILGETKSQLALYTLKELLEFVKDEDIISLIKKNISKLKISGIREEQDFYKTILPSTPYEAYSSYPDGHGNLAVIFSREKESSLQTVAIVLNDTTGIVDCFGFNDISKLEFGRIVDKFYENDERIYLDEHVIKRLITEAEKLSRKNGEKISYEYLCWKTLFADIQTEVVPLEISLPAKIVNRKISDIEYNRFCMMNFVQKWFFEASDSDVFASTISNLDNKVKSNNFDFDLEEIVESIVDNVFDEKQKNLLNKRILVCAYLKYLSGSRNDAEIIYSVYNDEDRLSDLRKNILRKSIYEHYVALKFRLSEEGNTTNIFSMRNKPKTSDFNLEYVEKAIKKIENLWVM